jgi:hypothetical protein
MMSTSMFELIMISLERCFQMMSTAQNALEKLNIRGRQVESRMPRCHTSLEFKELHPKLTSFGVWETFVWDLADKTVGEA